MYRYRYKGGTTRGAISRFTTPLAKLGKLLYVRAYRYQGIHGLNEAVLVRGENGTARFSGLCWGYGGEGPRGTAQLLIALGVNPDTAQTLAFKTPRKDEKGEDWRFSFFPNANGGVSIITHDE
jgi:hypothetical protein